MKKALQYLCGMQCQHHIGLSVITEPLDYDSRRAFYDLTVQLENGACIRYVGVAEADFDALEKGDPVLVLYFGHEHLHGYRLPKSDSHSSIPAL